MKLILSVLLFFTVAVNAQNINSIFIAMPDTLSPLLTKVNRQDFGDFLSSGMKAVVKNKFGGESEMTKLTDKYLSLNVSASSLLEMKLLPVNDSVNVVCVVDTYKGPVEDSKIRFYAENWKLLPRDKFISLPLLSDFYKTNDSLPGIFKDMFLYKAVLSDSSDELLFHINSLKATDKETSEKYSSHFKMTLKYKWKNGAFVRE